MKHRVIAQAFSSMKKPVLAGYDAGKPASVELALLECSACNTTVLTNHSISAGCPCCGTIMAAAEGIVEKDEAGKVLSSESGEPIIKTLTLSKAELLEYPVVASCDACDTEYRGSDEVLAAFDGHDIHCPCCASAMTVTAADGEDEETKENAILSAAKKIRLKRRQAVVASDDDDDEDDEDGSVSGDDRDDEDDEVNSSDDGDDEDGDEDEDDGEVLSSDDEEEPGADEDADEDEGEVNSSDDGEDDASEDDTSDDEDDGSTDEDDASDDGDDSTDDTSDDDTPPADVDAGADDGDDDGSTDDDDSDAATMSDSEFADSLKTESAAKTPKKTTKKPAKVAAAPAPAVKPAKKVKIEAASAIIPVNVLELAKASDTVLSMVSSGGRDPIYYVFANATPVAVARRALAKVELAKHYSTPVFATAFRSAVEAGLTDEVIADFGLEAVKIQTTVEAAIKTAADAEVNEIKASLNTQQASVKSRFEQCAMIAASGIAKGMFGEVENPLVASLVESLERVNVRDPQKLVASAMNMGADKFIKLIVAKALELQEKSADELKGISQMIKAAPYPQTVKSSNSRFVQELERGGEPMETTASDEYENTNVTPIKKLGLFKY